VLIYLAKIRATILGGSQQQPVIESYYWGRLALLLACWIIVLRNIIVYCGYYKVEKVFLDLYKKSTAKASKQTNKK